MADLIGVLRLGQPVPLPPVGIPAPPPRTAQVVAAAAPGDGSAAGAGTSDTLFQAPTGRGRGAAVSAHLSAVLEPRPPIDPDTLTGPPPAFEASLLELQADLRIQLARIAAERSAGSDPGRRAGIPTVSQAPDAVAPTIAPASDIPPQPAVEVLQAQGSTGAPKTLAPPPTPIPDPGTSPA